MLKIIRLLIIILIPINFALAADLKELEKKIGIKTLKANKNKVTISIDFPSICTFGDLDAIALDSGSSPKKADVILSFEPIGVTNVKPFSKVILSKYQSIDFLNEGIKVSIELPKVKEPTVFGLNVCLDNAGEKICKNKEVIPVNNIIKTYGFNRPPKDYVPGDKTYYFNYIIYDGKTIKFQEKLLGTANKKALKAYLNKILPLISVSKEQVYNVIDKNMTQLLSVPLKFDKKLSMELPHFDGDKCGRVVLENSEVKNKTADKSKE